MLFSGKPCLLYMQFYRCNEAKSVYDDIECINQCQKRPSSIIRPQHQKPTHAYQSQDAYIHQARPYTGHQDSLPSNPVQPCPI